MKNTFTDDLKYGKKGEKIVLNCLREKYPTAYICNGYEPKYDVFIPEIGVGIEVKVDRGSQKSDNIAIECEYKGKPSGIESTKALYWVHFYYNDGWLVVTMDTFSLNQLCKRFRPVPGGQGALVKLIPKHIIRENFQVLPLSKVRVSV